MLLLLFRDLSRNQQRELIIETQALFEANQIVKGQLKTKKLKPAGNEVVRAAFKDVPPPRKPKKKNPGRDMGDAMGDFLDD